MTPEPNQEQIPTSAAIVPVSGGNLELSASTPDEMVPWFIETKTL